MKRNLIAAFVLVVMTIGSGTAVLAGRGPGGSFGERPRAAVGPGGFFIRMAKVLKLTDAQQSQIKSLLSEERSQSEPLMEKMHENRKLLMQAGETATFDEASVRSIAAAISQTEIELAVIRVRTQSQIYTLLTAEQRELVKNLRPDKERSPGLPPA